MGKKFRFVAGLFVIALCALAVGGMNLYEHVDVWLHGKEATMELADPDKEVVLYDDAWSNRTLDVKYVSADGEVVVPQKVVTVAVAKRLAAGQRIPVTYMTNNHKKVLYQNYQLPNPWVWLVVGLLAFAIALYALKMLKRESGEE